MQAYRAAEALTELLSDEMSILATLTPRANFSVDCTPRNYDDSVKFCRDQGKTIASIHSQQEDLTVLGLVR